MINCVIIFSRLRIVQSVVPTSGPRLLLVLLVRVDALGEISRSVDGMEGRFVMMMVVGIVKGLIFLANRHGRCVGRSISCVAEWYLDVVSGLS